LAGKPRLRAALTFTKPGVRISTSSGRALPKHLHFDEMTRGGLLLHADAEVELHDDAGQQQMATALLWAGARFIERLGGNRRRGAGRCAVQLLMANPDACMRVLGNAAALPTGRTAPEQTGEQPAVGDARVRLALTLTAMTPLAPPARTAGNVVERLDYLPGTYLLPFITRRCAALGVDVRPAMMRGDVVVTHALPKVEGARGRPFPAALQRAKSGGQRLFNLLENAPADEQLKGERRGYVGQPAGHRLPMLNVPLRVTLHNTIQDDVQRPTEDIGGVYSFQAIPPGTRLHAEVRLPAALAAQLAEADAEWWSGFSGTYRVGIAKKGEYGEVAISPSEPMDVTSSPAASAPHQVLHVWLLSVVLLRDARLRPTADPAELARALGAELGVTLTPLRPQGNQLGAVGMQHRMESWQVQWGLPRPTLAGLSAGACLAFTVTGTLEPARLHAVELSGIGERRAEGYGQVSFNDPLLTASLGSMSLDTATPSAPAPREGDPTSSPLNDEQSRVARIIECAACREAIQRAAVELAAEKERRTECLGIQYSGKNSKPGQSQLMSLLAVLRRIQKPGDEKVREWLTYLEKTKGRKEEWEASIPTITSLVTEKDFVWQALADTRLIEPLRWDELTVSEARIAELQRELWRTAVWMVADACIRAHKRDEEENARQETGVTA